MSVRKPVHPNLFRFLAAFLTMILLPGAALPGESVRADEDYGEEACGYLRTITDDYGFRINNNEVLPNQETKAAMGEWINSKMTGFGYKATVISNEKDMSREHGNLVKDYCYFKQGASSKRIVIGAHYDSVDTHGTEDNGTGVAVLLELAHRMKNINTPMSLEFCFWDGEEYLGEAGSFHYVSQKIAQNDLQNILVYINLDCVGSGDHLFVYGGDWENDVLVRSWGYNMAMAVARDFGIDLHSLPKGLPTLHSPVSTSGSDHLFFADQKIPYIYFSATCMIDENGNVFYPTAPARFHTADPRVEATDHSIRGQIIHSEYDNMTVLEELFPGRFRQHFGEVIRICIRLLSEITTDSPAVFADPEPIRLTPETEQPTETPTAAPTAAPTEAQTEAPTEAPETAPPVTPSESEAGSTSASDPAPEPTEAPTEEPTERGTEKQTETQPTETVPPETLAPEKTEPAEQKPFTVPEIIALTLVGALAGIWIVLLIRYLKSKKP